MFFKYLKKEFKKDSNKIYLKNYNSFYNEFIKHYYRYINKNRFKELKGQEYLDKEFKKLKQDNKAIIKSEKYKIKR